MKKTLIATAVAGALAFPASAALAQAAAAPASPHSFTANVGVVSDYLFRGVSQTRGGPALQGGVDYAHASGLYAGVWASNITWVKDWLGDGNVEVDLYGGYKNSFGGGDWTYDVGLIRYQYPNAGNAQPTFLASPNTTEVYAALSYKWLTVKYSHAISKNFIGWYGGAAFDQDTRGSNYLEFNAAYDLGNGWGITGHYGIQKVKNSVAIPGVVTDANYNDWKLGVTKDVGFGVVGLAYSDTDASGSCGTPLPANASAYCWGTASNVAAATGPTTGFKNVAKGQVVLSFQKTF